MTETCDSGMKGRGVVLATMFMLFSMIQFLLNFAGAMGVVIQNQFGVSNALAQLGPAALFLAFLFMGIPGGIFMTMVCGGMLLPLQGLLADKIGILNSYALTILLFAYLFAYAAVLSRPKAQQTERT